MQFGLSGTGVAPAGVEKPNTGHHHLLIDTTLTTEQMKGAISAGDKQKHFGVGQTEAIIKLPKGKHTLQLVLGDWSHIPHTPPVMSKPVITTVRWPSRGRAGGAPSHGAGWQHRAWLCGAQAGCYSHSPAMNLQSQSRNAMSRRCP
jgi:hypothetical protein